MQKATGLRTEIIVNISLLLGAALLFSGFLLLKFTERELLTQRIEGVAGTLEIVSRSLTVALRNPQDLATQTEALLKSDPARGMEGWQLVDRNLIPLAKKGAMENPPSESREFLRMRYAVEADIQVHYPLTWVPFLEVPRSYLIITVPLRNGGEFIGALQASFSLADLRLRMRSAYKLIFLYIVLYGTVLVLFGIYLLSRTVIRPVRRLQRGTQQIAAGDLNHFLPVAGPREIADLAGSFNFMIAALKASGEKTDATIISLRKVNEDLRRTRDELIRSEKMASVGHLAAGMAHEIGNPLGAVIGYLELLQSELPSGREKDILERSLAEAQRIDLLVRDLLDYASPASVQPELLDPVNVLAEARDILRHQGILAGLHLVDNSPPSLPLVFVARHKLLQVFVNLILNARDASAPGGTIRFEAAAEQDEIRLSIIDEGSGMSPNIMAHIFDPFYTTKPPDKGKGLGLSVCYRVIDEAGGRIEVSSAEKEGSMFTVWLRKAEIENEEA